MDSGNSGSLQSSSGGDEECDSRSESVPAFLNSFLSNHQNQQQQQHPLFDHPSNYLHTRPQSQPSSNPSSLLNLDLVGSRSLRSEPSCTNGAGNLQGAIEHRYHASRIDSIFANTQGVNHVSYSTPSSMGTRLLNDNGARSSAPSDHLTNVAKNPKKRTRTSRSAPTTVLNTDTSNFRAMVQEFTGIPAPPFSGSSYSRRIDLFGSLSGIKSGNLEPVAPLYPLRPTTQKFQPKPFVTSSSVIDAIATSTIASSTNDNTITTSISVTSHNSLHSPSNNNYQVLPDLGLNKEPQNMLNMHQNPASSFQSLLLSCPLIPSLNIPGFGAKSQGSFGLPSFEDHLGINQGHVNSSIGSLPNHVTSGQDHLRSFDVNYGNPSSQRVASCKLNYSTSSSDFHHDKNLENVSSRGEGTVDSWICPPD